MSGEHRKVSSCMAVSLIAFGLLASSATAARAANLEELQAQMRAMQAQMTELQRQVEQARAAAASAKASADAGGSDVDLKVKWKGAPELSSRDGQFEFKVRGRLQADFDSIDQDFPITGDQNINGVEIRRARLGVEGVVFYDWNYKFEMEFAGDEAEVKDAYIAYTGFDFADLEILVGNFRVANSLESVTSNRYITFMERAAFINAFDIDREIGVGVHAGGDHWSFQTSYTGAKSENQETFFDDPSTFAIRATAAPINNDTTVVHVGASYRHRNAGTSRDDGFADLFRYRARGANLHLADRFVATPNFAENDDMYVLEGAVVLGRWAAQGEYAELTANAAQTIADVSPTYQGWYVQGSVFLTDEMLNYDAGSGEFKRVKVKNPVFGGNRGWGAWQLAAGYDVINLADGAAAFNNSMQPNAVQCTDCGDQETWLLALNWLLTDYTAIKLNVTQSEISGGANDGATISGFGMRAQIDW